MPGLYDFSVRNAQGEPVALSRFAGKVLLVVNTASQCGFTKQYAGLETLYRDFQERGLVVLGFPCNQFGGQEPGDAEEIASFCSLIYDVTFPVLAKIEVNGAGEDPLYTWLKGQAPGVLGTRGIKWNFTKFLIDRTGKVAGRFAPLTDPRTLRDDIEKLL